MVKKTGIPPIGFSFTLVMLLAVMLLTNAVAEGQLELVTCYEDAWLETLLDEFTSRTGIDVTHVRISDLEVYLRLHVNGGDPPDVAIIRAPGPIEYFAEGALMSLGGIIDLDSFDHSYDQDWRDLVSVNGLLYGIPFSSTANSLLWFNPNTFFDYGIGFTPQTWDDLLRLATLFRDRGIAPFSLGASNSSMPVRWIQNIFVQVAGRAVYYEWARSELPWTDPRVREAFEYFGQIIRPESNLPGGVQETLQMTPLDAFQLMLGGDAALSCYGGRVSRLTEGYEPVSEFAFFNFPQITPSIPLTTVIAFLDAAVVFRNSPESRQLIQFLATAEAGEIWVSASGFVSPNRDVHPLLYPEFNTMMAAYLLHTTPLVIDALEVMPWALGYEFEEKLVEFIAYPERLDSILESLDRIACEFYEDYDRKPGWCP